MCYEEGITLGIEQDITKIPAPVQTVTNQSMPPNLSRIYFDIEATGLSKYNKYMFLGLDRDYNVALSAKGYITCSKLKGNINPKFEMYEMDLLLIVNPIL